MYEQEFVLLFFVMPIVRLKHIPRQRPCGFLLGSCVCSKGSAVPDTLQTYTVDESVIPGNYTVGFIFRSAYNYDENLVTFTVVPATVTVKAKSVPVNGIALDRETASIGTGETLTLTPIFSPETATNKNVTWASSDKTVATVENGIVTPLKKGTTTITVTTEDGGFSASCLVTVNCSHLNTTDVPAEDSTCIKRGHKAYTVCNDCGEVTQGSNSELSLCSMS